MNGFVYVAIILAFLGLLGYVVYDGFGKLSENDKAYEMCQKMGALPIWTKDNVLVCVEAKREKDRQ